MVIGGGGAGMRMVIGGAGIRMVMGGGWYEDGYWGGGGGWYEDG